MSSFTLTLTFDEKEQFNGRLSQTYDPPISLSPGKWEVAVIRFRSSDDTPQGGIFLFSNVVKYSYVNGKKMRFLDNIDFNVNNNYSSNNVPRYVPLGIKKFITHINIDIRVKPEESPDESTDFKSNIVCVLHFRKA